MDILARIEQVIRQRGTNKTEVAERMGKAPQNFNSLLTNPKWDTLEAVASALGCPVWHLFLNEIEAAGYKAAPQPLSEERGEQCPEQPSATQSSIFSSPANDLPFTGNGQQEPQISAPLQQTIVCPHCHKAMVVTMVTPL